MLMSRGKNESACEKQERLYSTTITNPVSPDPHCIVPSRAGIYFLGAVFFALVACAVDIFAVMHCSLVTITSGGSQAGYFGTNHDFGCQAWTQDEKEEFFNGGWKFGMAMGLIAGYGGLLALGLNVSILFVTLPRKVLKILAGVYVTLACATVVMVVMGLTEEYPYNHTSGDEVRLGLSAFLALFVACPFYICASVCTFKLEREVNTETELERTLEHEREASKRRSSLKQMNVPTGDEPLETQNPDVMEDQNTMEPNENIIP